MIGTIAVKVNAARPNMPLDPIFTVKGSPSSIRVMDVPKGIGKWTLNAVKVVVNYPDNETTTTNAVRNGSVWVATFAGCSVVGKVANGYKIVADGVDENENNVTGYVLGVGDIYVLDGTPNAIPSDARFYVRYCPEVPNVPVKGDCVVVEENENTLVKIYDGTEWKNQTLFTKTSELVNDSGFITASAIPSNVSQLTNDVGFITSSAIPSSVSAFENDAGYITANALPTKTSDLVNDSGFVTSTELENGVEKLVEDANDEHSTRVVVDEYDNVFVQKYTTGWYVSKIEVSIGTTTDYTETNEYYAYLTDVRLDTEASRLYYTIAVQDKQRNLSPYKNSYSTPDYSTGEFITTIGWTATQTGGQAIYLHLTVTNAETPVWVNIARLVPDSAKRSGLLDTQITPYGQFLTPTQVKPYDQIPGYARRAYGSLFMFGRKSILTPDENHYVTIDYNVGKLCYVGQTQYPWQLSMYNGTTFDPPIQMNYGYRSTVGYKYNGRNRNISINSNCWLGIITVDSRNTRPCYIKGIENEYGSIVPDNNFYYYNESYPITFSANKLSIETIDGVEGGITCTRQGTGTHQTELKYVAYEDSVPTKTSDLTNDSGFITLAQVPTPSYIEDANGNKVEADLDYEIHNPTSTNWTLHYPQYFGQDVTLEYNNGAWRYEGTNHYPQHPQQEKVTLEYSNNTWSFNTWYYDTQTSAWIVRDECLFNDGERAEDITFVCYARITRTMDDSGKLAKESDLPTKTSDLTNDSGFITTNDIITKRDVTDFNVYGDPLSSGDMKFKFKAVGINGTHQTTEGTMTIDPSNPTLTWVWTNGSASCSIEYTGEGYVFIYNYLSDGLNQFNGQFTMPITEPKWSCDYADGVFDFTIVSSKGTIATQEWVLDQLATLQARISALENN